MNEQFFEYAPTIELLQSLVSGLLKQKGVLAKAIRLWVILRSLYGNEGDPLFLESTSYHDTKSGNTTNFSCGKWYKELQAKDNNLSNNSLNDWLFSGNLSLEERNWRKIFQQQYNLTDTELNQILPEKITDKNKDYFPFAVDERTLRNDFSHLLKN